MNNGTIFAMRGPFGAPIEFHSTLIMLMLFIVMMAATSGLAFGLVHGGMIVAILILSTLLHELGHAWGAWVQGVRVHRVVIHGGGGYCMHDATDARRSELIVLMGPLTNLAVWALASLAVQWTDTQALGPNGLNPTYLILGDYLHIFAKMNLFFFALNLLPMNPLDGGRLLFLWLLRAMPRRDASIWAGRIGLAACVIYPFAMIWAFVNFGWLFLFLPTFGLHLALARGERVL